MQPGKELDFKIANQVMGLIRGVETVTTKDGKREIRFLSGKKRIRKEDVPPYSTDEKAALEVVERIEKYGGLIERKFFERYDGFDLKPVIPGQPIEPVRIDPYEICIAALAATESLLDEVKQRLGSEGPERK